MTLEDDGTWFLLGEQSEATVRALADGRVSPELQQIAVECLQIQQQGTLRYEASLDAERGDVAEGPLPEGRPGEDDVVARSTASLGGVRGVRA